MLIPVDGGISTCTGLSQVPSNAAVAQAAGVNLPADYADTMIDIIHRYPAKARASLLIDFERKRRVELEHITGAVVRHGQAVGVPTSGFAALYAVLKVKAISYGGLPPAASGTD